MVVELKDKLEAVAIETEKPVPSSPAGVEADVKSALLNLGYDQHAAEGAVELAGKNGASETFEALLRGALQQLTAPAQSSARAAR
jgi:Holliday junction resolvasome RuvABC DNA-binding subunit